MLSTDENPRRSGECINLLKGIFSMEKTTAEICRDKGLNFDVISNKALDVAKAYAGAGNANPTGIVDTYNKIIFAIISNYPDRQEKTE